MSANFNSLSIAITTMVDAHYWEKVIILYDVMGFPEIMGNFCYLAVSAVVYYGKKLQNRPFEFHIFNPEKYDPENMLKDKVGLKFGGESLLRGKGRGQRRESGRKKERERKREREREREREGGREKEIERVWWEKKKHL